MHLGLGAPKCAATQTGPAGTVLVMAQDDAHHHYCGQTALSGSEVFKGSPTYVATLAFAVINISIWSLWWVKPLDVDWPILVGSSMDIEEVEHASLSLSQWVRLVNGDYSPYHVKESTLVPTFWSMDDQKSEGENVLPLVILILFGAIFGAIHCAARNAHFTSTIKMWMEVLHVIGDCNPCGLWITHYICLIM
ncbi:hypothetical protein C8R44DRAFT_742441 [Mycena epipterygia]|nr:hypothetical protein C8R44DRAFT_742441 [Mycena epipterygia]